MRRKIIILLFPVLISICSLMPAAHAGQDNLTAGMRAHERGDYQEAVREYGRAGARGQFIAGMLYYYGSGVRRDLAQAAFWLNKAAEQGHKGASYQLAVMYENGYGIRQDAGTAAKWYRRAAESGVADAESRLGIMYKEGRGVAKDYSEAVRWLRKAAGKGRAEAQFALGTMLEKGQGIKRDTAEAAKWYRMAAAHALPGKTESRTQWASCDDPVRCVTD